MADLIHSFQLLSQVGISRQGWPQYVFRSEVFQGYTPRGGKSSLIL